MESENTREAIERELARRALDNYHLCPIIWFHFYRRIGIGSTKTAGASVIIRWQAPIIQNKTLCPLWNNLNEFLLSCLLNETSGLKYTHSLRQEGHWKRAKNQRKNTNTSGYASKLLYMDCTQCTLHKQTHSSFGMESWWSEWDSRSHQSVNLFP